MGMETIEETQKRSAECGFDKELAVRSGKFRYKKLSIAPDTCVIKEVIRYEGASDPADQGILFAIECLKCGFKGTFSAAYGTGVSAREGQMLNALAAQLKNASRC